METTIETVKAPKFYPGPDWQCNPVAMRLLKTQAKSRGLSVNRYLAVLVVEALLSNEQAALRAAEPPQKLKARKS